MVERREAAMAKVRANMQEVADSLRHMVAGIESDVPTTRGHYDRYFFLLDNVSKGNVETAKIIAEALVMCGANEQGVADALVQIMKG